MKADVPHKTFIIAEAGVNHCGNIELALKMVHEAKRAGADAVKFQTFHAEDLVTADAPKARYQKENDGASSQFEMLKRLELSEEDHKAIMAECEKVGIEFMSTPFSIRSARFLKDLGMKTWKIPSGEITNRPLLEYIAGVAEKVIMSTGMTTTDEITEAVVAMLISGLKKENLYLLHCTTAYPTQLADVNLRAMEALRKFACKGVGYSDHTQGILAPVAAVAMGALIIEKHFTLDRNLPGPDHKASLLPDEFARMVADIRDVEKAMGDGTKKPVKAEIPNKAIARKSIVAACPISKGEKFTADNLTTKRPGTGISPMRWYELIGKKAKHNYNIDDLILNSEIK